MYNINEMVSVMGKKKKMPEYVYALHDFLPENEDEVDFRAGERIEVVEKDDLYGDGWWQVLFIPSSSMV